MSAKPLPTDADITRAAMLAAIARIRDEYERAVQPYVAQLCRLEAGLEVGEVEPV